MEDHSIQLHPTINPLTAYAELPKGVDYQDREPQERVEVLLRRHIITNSGWIILTILGLIAPPVVHAIHPQAYIGLEWLTNIPQQTFALAAILWYLIVVAFGLINFLSWYFNVYLITSERLVDVDFLGLLQYSSSEAALHQIQDVEHKQTGIWQLLFNYGSVEAQTAGSRQNIVFEKVPKPNRVTDIITDLLPTERDIRETSDENANPQADANSGASTAQPNQEGDLV